MFSTSESHEIRIKITTAIIRMGFWAFILQFFARLHFSEKWERQRENKKKSKQIHNDFVKKHFSLLKS